jgi:hypothetical protein
MIGNSPEVSNFNLLFLNLNQFIGSSVTNHRFSPSPGLNSLAVCFNVEIRDTWEEKLTIRSEIWIENTHSQGFWDVRGVTLRRLILRSLECTCNADSYLLGGGRISGSPMGGGVPPDSTSFFPMVTVRSWSSALASQHQPAVPHEILIPGQVMNEWYLIRRWSARAAFVYVSRSATNIDLSG